MGVPARDEKQRRPLIIHACAARVLPRGQADVQRATRQSLDISISHFFLFSLLSSYRRSRCPTMPVTSLPSRPTRLHGLTGQSRPERPLAQACETLPPVPEPPPTDGSVVCSPVTTISASLAGEPTGVRWQSERLFCSFVTALAQQGLARRALTWLQFGMLRSRGGSLNPACSRHYHASD